MELSSFVITPPTALSLLLMTVWTLFTAETARQYPITNIRIQDTSNISGEGYLAIETAIGVWKPVCFYHSDPGLAELTCKHLGFVGVPRMKSLAEPVGSLESYAKSSSLRCEGDSSLLDDCTAMIFMGKCEHFTSITCDSTPMSCAERCGQPSNYYSCGCDDECLTFGDCCMDVSSACAEYIHPSVGYNISVERARFEDYTRCVTSFNRSSGRATITQPTKYKMVAICPDTWQDSSITEKCLSNDTSDYLQLLPVHNDAGILFKNTYCALCHGAYMEEILPWQLVSTNSQDLHVFPRRNVFGSHIEVCDEELTFFKSCPTGTNWSMAYKCEHFVNSFLISTRTGIKNSYCKECINIKLSEGIGIRPVTFDVVFGVKSWSSLRSSCRNNRMSGDNLFQNACPLLEKFNKENNALNTQKSSTSHEECTRQFLSDIFPSRVYNVLTPEPSHDDIKDNNMIPVLLPNALIALYLETAIDEGLVIPQCSMDLNVSLLVEGDARCHYQADYELFSAFVDSNNQSYYNIFNIRCKNSCRIVDQHEAVCVDLVCRWEDEFLPMIDFKIIDFVAMEIVHIHSGAVLTENQFMFTERKEIHTCSEYLIGGWTLAAFYIQLICGPLSLICIILMVIIHVIFPKLRNIYGFCIVSLLSMLFVALFSFMLTTFSQMVDGLAQVVVAMNHYAWLSAFAWMTVISFHVSHTFGGRFVANRMSKVSSRKELLFYGLFGWGVPLPVFLIGVILHLCDCTSFHYAKHWMSRGILTVLLFSVPALLLAVLTAVFFVIGITKLRQRQKPQDQENSSQMSKTHNYLVALRLFFIVGIPWVLFVVYIASRNRFLLPVLTLVNSLQGCFIFLSFVTTRRVRALLREKFDSQWTTTGTQYSKARPTETGTLDNLTPNMNRVKGSSSGTPPSERK